MIRYLSSSFLLIVFCVIAMAGPVSAIAPPATFAVNTVTGSVDCSGTAGSSAVCTDNKTPDTIYGNGGIFEDITNIIAFVAGGGAILLLIVSGIRYITSAGDANKVNSAKGTIIATLIGLAVIVLARSLINYVVNRL